MKRTLHEIKLYIFLLLNRPSVFSNEAIKLRSQTLHQPRQLCLFGIDKLFKLLDTKQKTQKYLTTSWTQQTSPLTAEGLVLLKWSSPLQ